jgi:cell division protein FtsB
MLSSLINHRLTRLIILILGGYLVVQTSRNVAVLWGAKGRVDQAESRLQELQKQNEALKLQQENIGKPEFVEREARDKLGLVRENEVVLVLPADQVQKLADSLREEYQKSNQEIAPDLPNWQQWLKLFTD